MRNSMRWGLVLLLAVVPAAAWAATSVGVRIGVSNGPATLRIAFNTQPDVMYLHDDDVYVVNDRRCPDDMFRYRDTWWVVRDDHWYRARDWHGTFVRVRENDVPPALWRVPDNHWKHHPHGMPPGLAKKMDRDDRWADRDRGRDRREYGDRDDRGRDNGRGRGHDKDRGRDRGNDRND